MKRKINKKKSLGENMHGKNILEKKVFLHIATGA